MPVWTLTLLTPDRARHPRIELAPVAVEVGAQLLRVRVLRPDLADLAADADRDPVRLERPDQRRQLGGTHVVLALLLIDRRLREVDERRGIDVDVAIAGIDREAAGAPDLLGHRLGVGGVLLGVELVVVALDEHRGAPARRDRPGENGGREVDRALVRVGLLAARDLEDDRADLGAGGGLEGRPGHVERLGAQVDRRDREARHLAAATGRVQVLDARATAPSAWLASQTIHWAAAVVASSVENAAVQARSRIAVDRNAASSSMTSTSPSRCAAARMVESRSAVEVATWGIGGASPWQAFPVMVRRDRRAVPPAALSITSSARSPS